jgi:hypothetical protein
MLQPGDKLIYGRTFMPLGINNSWYLKAKGINLGDTLQVSRVTAKGFYFENMPKFFPNSTLNLAESVSDIAHKDSGTKVSYIEIDERFIADMARRLNKFKVEYGGKYKRFNYHKLTDMLSIIDASQRHLADLKCLLLDQEPIHNPDETQQDHTLAVSINMMIINYHLRHKIQ